ncbi:MAG: ABC transporter ATP-binding protein, partial [Bacteroidales bacterium]|nr:ABC transporter ATP-binding protein [Bacteroidales bacterium]
MRQFWNMLVRYALPYRRYLGGSIVMSILSAIFNIFSFTLIIPILKILFSVDQSVYNFIPWSGVASIKEKAVTNMYAMVSEYIGLYGPGKVLLLLCIFLCVMTFLKTSCYFGASAVMVPIRTGIVKDLRTQIYDKILSLPLGFFSRERKGDI